MRIEPGRDYYADLGLDFPADEASIKHRYRKAALKYHPDRNPGNEVQAQTAFVVIQSAFDILSDSVTKEKYDSTYLQKFGPYRQSAKPAAPPPASYGQPAGPAASAGRGNPWQDAGKDFPPPPQRTDRRARQPAPPPPPPTGGQRWQQWQQFKRPPTAKEADPENVFEAFTHMRPRTHRAPPPPPPREFPQSQQPQPPQPPPPPPPRDEREARRERRREEPRDDDWEQQQQQQPPLPPRTASMRHRAEAGFGNRKAGYSPHSPMPEDEPQVASTKNYETSRHTADLFTETARGARAAAAAASAAFAAGIPPTSAAEPTPGAASGSGAGAGSATEDSHDERRDSFFRERRPSEYRSHGGEKYDPFDGTGKHRGTRSRRRRAQDPSDLSDTPSATGTSIPKRSSSIPADDLSAANASARWGDADLDSDRPRTAGRMPTDLSAAAADSYTSSPKTAGPNPNPNLANKTRPVGMDSADELSPHSTPHEPGDQKLNGARPDPEGPTGTPMYAFQTFGPPATAAATAAACAFSRQPGFPARTAATQYPYPPHQTGLPYPLHAASFPYPLHAASHPYPHLHPYPHFHPYHHPHPPHPHPHPQPHPDPRQPAPAPRAPSSGARTIGADRLTPFEHQQHSLLSTLLGKPSPASLPRQGGSGGSGAAERAERAEFGSGRSGPSNGGSSAAKRKTSADGEPSSSFQFSTHHDGQEPARTRNDGGFAPTAGPEDIRFAAADDRNDYQFSAGGVAGGGAGSGPDRLRPKRTNHRRSPLQNEAHPTTRRPDDVGPGSRPDPETEPEPEPGHGDEHGHEPDPDASSDRGFDPNQWKQQFGPHTFVPKPSSRASSSPSRATSSRRAKSVKPTMGNAGLADESTGDEADAAQGVQLPQPEPEERPSPDVNDAHSTSAMDIDPEPPATAAALAATAPKTNGARNIPVEPSRPDWRAGSAAGIIPEPAKSTPNLKMAGSEDSEEYFTVLTDLKNVVPLASEGAGLGSLADLGVNLPFETQASARIPISSNVAAAELPFPPVPQAPPLPVCLVNGIRQNQVWEMYSKLFETYMRLWDDFNDRVVAHFAARSGERKTQGYGFLTTRGDAGLHEYCRSLSQDMTVRQKWTTAWMEHEQRVGEFMEFRDKMT